MQLPPEDKESREPYDMSHTPSSQRLVLLEVLVCNAAFPIYGLIGHPSGLTLRGIGYCNLVGHLGQPIEVEQPDQPLLVSQVLLEYDYPPAHRLTGHSLQLSTINYQLSPTQTPAVDFAGTSQIVHYLAPEDVPVGSSGATSFIVEQLQIVDGIVTAAMHYSANSLLSLSVVKPARLSTWSFTLWDPPLWVEGHASGWTQGELCSVLSKLAIVSQRPEVLRQYARELQAWDHLNNFPLEATDKK